MEDPEIIISPVANKVKRWEDATASSAARRQFEPESDHNKTQQRSCHESPNPEVGARTMNKKSQALRDPRRSTTTDRHFTKEERTKEENAEIKHASDERDFRQIKNGPVSHVIVRPCLSEGSESLPSHLKSDSVDDNPDLDWMRSQAQRIHKLNSIKVPQEIVGDYEKSHIVRTKLVVDEEEMPPKNNFLCRFRKLVGAGKTKTYKNPALVEVQEKRKGTRRRNETPVSKKDSKLSIKPAPMVPRSKNTASVLKDKVIQRTSGNAPDPCHKKKMALQPPVPAKLSTKQSLNNELLAVFEKRRKLGSIKESSDVPVPTEVPSDTSLSPKNHQTSDDSPPRRTIPAASMAVQIPIQQETSENIPPTSPPLGAAKAKATTKPVSTKAPTITTADDIVLASLQEYASNSIVEGEIPKTLREDEDFVSDFTSNDAIGAKKVLSSCIPSGRGNFLTDWLTNKVDALANIGYEQSCSFLDWNGEETKIAMLEVVTKLTREDTTARLPEARKVPKLRLTKRVLTKEEVRARIMEEKRRRRQFESLNPGDDGDYVSQSKSDSSSSSLKEVKSLTLDSFRVAPPPLVNKKKHTKKSSVSTFNKQAILPHAQKLNVKKDPPALNAYLS